MSVDELLSTFRRAGFFAGRSDAEVREAVARLESPEDASPFELLAADETRVVGRDTECDAFEGNDAYVRWGNDVARLMGRDDLRVRERWREGGPGDPRVELLVQDGPRRGVVYARDFGDHLDADTFVIGVNRVLPPDGERLWCLSDGGSGVFLIRATKAEIERLEAEWSWRFGPDEPPPSRTRAVGGASMRLRRWWDGFWAPFRM